MVINGNEWDPIALANEMNHVYNRFKHLNDGNASDYISVYFGQIWIPDIFEDTEEALKQYGLWLEDIGVNVIEDYDMSDDIHPFVISVRLRHWTVGWIDTIMIHEDSTPDIWNEVNNINDRLSDYPVLDDDDFYEKELDIINESYDSYIKDEFMDIIKKHFDLYDIEEKDNVMSKWYLDELMDLCNTEYIVEDNSAYVYHINDIAIHLDIEKVKEYFNIEFFEEE